MCGTSGDGISAALIATRGYGKDREIRLLSHCIVPYPPSLRERLFRLFPPQAFTAMDLAHVHRELGDLLAEAALEVMRLGRRQPRGVDAIAVQAPTLIHEPPRGDGLGVHLEVGEAAILSERTGLPVVCDLRPSDMAAGGHGAPLSAFVDYVLFSHPELGRAVQNIGGIANVTYLPPGSDLPAVLAFDTGPGTMVIDGVVRSLTGGREAFDRDGRWAARGSVHAALLEELMRHPYLERRPPKTTGREEFGDPFVAQVLRRASELGVGQDDLVATVTAYTAECIALHYRRELVPLGRLDEVILYGGGAFNPVLVAMIEQRIAPCRLRMHAEFGIPGEAREAVTWAVLADEALAGHPANVPHATGARHPVLLGKVVQVWPGGTPWKAS